MPTLSDCIKLHGLSGRDKTVLLRDARKHMGPKFRPNKPADNVKLADFIGDELDRLDVKRKDIYDQIMKEVGREGQKEGRVARSEREGQEPGRAVSERGPGRQKAKTGGVLETGKGKDIRAQIEEKDVKKKAYNTQTIQKAFPGSQVTQVEDGWTVGLPNGERIVVREAYIQVADTAGNTKVARGAWVNKDRTMWLTSTKAGVDTVYHEAFHAAWGMALTPKERAALTKKYGSEESAAEAYTFWKIAVRREDNNLFQKIMDFFTHLQNVLYRDVGKATFERIESGAVLKRHQGKGWDTGSLSKDIKNAVMQMDPGTEQGFMIDGPTETPVFNVEEAIKGRVQFQGIEAPHKGKWMRGEGAGKVGDAVNTFAEKLSDDVLMDFDQVGSVKEAVEFGNQVEYLSPKIKEFKKTMRWSKPTDAGVYGNSKMKYPNEMYPRGRNTWDIAGCGREAWAVMNGIDLKTACYGGACYAEAVKVVKQGKKAGVTSGINKHSLSPKARVPVVNYFSKHGYEKTDKMFGDKYAIEVRTLFPKDQKLLGTKKQPKTFFKEDGVWKKITIGYYKQADGTIIDNKDVKATRAIAGVVTTSLQPAKGQDIRIGVDTDGSAWLANKKVMNAILKADPRTLSVYSSAYHTPPPAHELSARTIINVTVSGWHPLPETVSRIRWAEQARANGWTVILREVVADPGQFTPEYPKTYNRLHDAIMSTNFFVMQQPLHVGGTHGKPMWGMPSCCVGSKKNPHKCDQCEVTEGLGRKFKEYWNIREEVGRKEEQILPDVGLTPGDPMFKDQAQFQFAQDPSMSQTKAAVRVKRNPAFRKWFKGSKVVDDNGNPLVVYHGTSSKDFGIFDFSKLGKATQASSATHLGFFFSSPEVAGMFTGYGDKQRLVPTFLNIKNPKVISATEFQEYLFGENAFNEKFDDLKNAIESDYGSNLEIYDGIVQYISDRDGQPTDIDESKLSKEGTKQYEKLIEMLNQDPREESGYGYTDEDWKKLKQQTKKEGHDGIMVESNDFSGGFYDIEQAQELLSDNYIAFSPTQIKSIYNQGTFSATDPDIRYQVKSGAVSPKGEILYSGKNGPTVRLYHGMPKDSNRLKTGYIKSPAYFTPNKEAAGEYGEHGEFGGTIIEVDVPVDELKVDFDLPDGRLLSIEAANSYSGNEEWAIEDYINAGYSVGVEKDFVFDEKKFKSLATDPDIRYQVEAFQGSPHDVTKSKEGRLSTKYIGTGQGAAAFGWGLYFSDLKSIARTYAKMRDKHNQLDEYVYDDLKQLYHDNEGAFTTEKKAEDALFEATLVDSSDVDPNDTKIKEVWVSGPGGEAVLFKKRDNGKWDSKLPKSQRNLYKVTLHKGKKPGEYTWLDWDKIPTISQMNKILSQAEKEGVKLIPPKIWKPIIEDVKSGALAEDFPYGNQIYRELGRAITSGLRGSEADRIASLFLLRAGIDGIRYPVGSLSAMKDRGKKNYVVFDENAITIDEHVRFQMEVGPGPVWYSQMEKHLGEKLPNKGTPKSYKQTINSWAKKGELKQEELDWSGLSEWLSEQKGKLTKQQILDYLVENNVRVEEVVKGGTQRSIDQIQSEIESRWDVQVEFYPDGAKVIPFDDDIVLDDPELQGLLQELDEITNKNKGTRFDQWRTEGGENYRELLLTLPTGVAGKQDKLNKITKEYKKWTQDQNLPYESMEDLSYRSELTDEQRIELQRFSNKWDDALENDEGAGNQFTVPPAHAYGDTASDVNRLAHVRFDERTDVDGNRVLFIDEIQSDWHQQGRKEGYKSGGQEAESKFKKKMAEKYGESVKPSMFTEDELSKWKKLHELAVQDQGIIPNAPFKKTWPMLAIKRMVRWAAENGFDKVAWTPGEIQADRYDLSKHIGNIKVSKMVGDGTGKGVHGEDAYNIHVTSIYGEKLPARTLAANELEGFIGKEMAEKITSDERLNKPSKKIQRVEYKGLDLKVGGEGMKGFYDKILPAAVNKFFNKAAWGKAKVGVSEIDTTKENWRYEGPNYTVDELIKKRDAAPRKADKAHLTQMINTIEDLGATFQELADDISPNVASYLGGEIVKTSAHQEVWSLPITEKMRTKALTEGMAQFQMTRQYTPEQIAYRTKGGFGQRQKQTIGEKISTAKVRLGAKLRQGIVDQYDSFKRILDDEKAWMMAHLTKSDTGVLMTAVNVGTPFINNSRQGGGSMDIIPDSKSLKDILQPLGNEMDDFLAWIAAHRAANLSKQDRENLFTDAHIAGGKTLDQGQMADGRNRATVYNQARDEFEKLGNAISKIGVDTGLISRREARRWQVEGWYVPFYRMLDNENARGPTNIDSLTNQKAYKRLKGGTSQIEDLLTNTMMNWSHIISAGLRNQAGRKALKTAEQMGLANEVHPDAKTKDAVYIRENGKEKWYEIVDSPDGALVLDSLLSLNYEGLNNPAMKAMRLFKRALTIGVTASPGFKIRNLIRDTIHAAAVTNASPNMFKNLYVGSKKDTKRMEVGGGAFGESGYIHGSDPDALKRLVGINVDPNTILDNVGKFKKVWKAYQDFGARLENVNRVAGFENDLKKGKTLLEANFNARDQLDFARTGSYTWVRFIAQSVPFLNARMQGLDKMGRSALDPSQRKQFIAVAGTYTVAATLLYLMMKDDDDYLEAEDWEKRTYHLFKIPGSDKMYRIPRPFEVGAMAYMAEKITEQFMDENAKVADLKDGIIHTLGDTFAFNPIPQAFKPLVEIYSNTSMFTGRPIESLGMKYLTKPERYKPWTSEVAKGVSQAMGATLPEGATLSPVQIQHLVRAYTGWLGATTLAGMDGIIRTAGGKKMPLRKWYEYEPLKTMVRDSKARNSKYMTEFYNNLNEMSKLWGDVRKYKGTPKGHALLEKYSDKLQFRKRYNRKQRELSKLRKRQAVIYKSRKMSRTQKRLAIDQIKYRMNKVVKELTDLSRPFF